MAIRHQTSNNNNLARTANIPSGNFTFMCWVKFLSLGSGFQTVFFRGDASFNEWPFFGKSNTDHLHCYNGSLDISGSALSANTWYHIAVVRNSSTDWKMYLNGVQDGTGASEGTNASSSMRIFSDTPFDGSNGIADAAVAAVKIWDTNLSVAEIQQEMRQYLPFRTANLNIFTPGNDAAIADAAKDYSGNGNNWTVNGTLTTEDGPPIPWKQGRRTRIVFPAAAGGGSALTLSVSDSVSFSDAPTKSDSKPISDAVTLAESLAKAFSKSSSDSVTVSDTRVLTAAKVLAEALNVSDARALTLAKALSEAIALGDSSTAFLVKVLAVVDAIGFSEARTLAAIKVIAEAVTVTDARALAAAKSPFVETIGLIDSKAMSAGKTAQETVSLADGGTRTAGKTVIEILGLGDAKEWQISKGWNDTLSIGDSSMAVLNGQEPAWIKAPLTTVFRNEVLKTEIDAELMETRMKDARITTEVLP